MLRKTVRPHVGGEVKQLSSRVAGIFVVDQADLVDEPEQQWAEACWSGPPWTTAHAGEQPLQRQ